MKHFKFLCIVIAIIFSSCKNNDKSTNVLEAAPPQKKEQTDLGNLYQYYHANPTTLNQKDENTLIEYAADNNMDVTRTRSGVYIQIHTEGTGEQVKWGDPISVDYKGYTLDGKEFDSSYSRGEPISFRVGNMNPGWNEALPHLKRGSKATFLLPSHMAYGKKGFPGYIDPDTNIAFDVEVLDQ